MSRSGGPDGGLFGDGALPEQLSPALAARRAGRRAAADAARDKVLAILAAAPADAVCGLDEVGRGPLAGPVVAAAVVLDPKKPIAGLDDSKRLGAETRAALDPQIRGGALAWGLGWAWPDEIERLNILGASLLAMRRAFAAMLGLPLERGQAQRVAPEGDCAPGILDARRRPALAHAVVDGNKAPDLGGLPWGGAVHTLVKGDALCPAVSAASIIAKVARDNWMAEYAALDGRYGFERHAGYGTPEHLAALAEHGPCPIHRLSWLKPDSRA